MQFGSIQVMVQCLKYCKTVAGKVYSEKQEPVHLLI